MLWDFRESAPVLCFEQQGTDSHCHHRNALGEKHSGQVLMAPLNEFSARRLMVKNLKVNSVYFEKDPATDLSNPSSVSALTAVNKDFSSFLLVLKLYMKQNNSSPTKGKTLMLTYQTWVQNKGCKKTDKITSSQFSRRFAVRIWADKFYSK